MTTSRSCNPMNAAEMPAELRSWISDTDIRLERTGAAAMESQAGSSIAIGLSAFNSLDGFLHSRAVGPDHEQIETGLVDSATEIDRPERAVLANEAMDWLELRGGGEAQAG